jgi:hypothetical protein
MFSGRGKEIQELLSYPQHGQKTIPLKIGPCWIRKKWKRLRDGWILDPFTAIRLYLLPQAPLKGGTKLSSP